MPRPKTCELCGGPKDPLHTAQECVALARASGFDEPDRYDLAVVGAVINGAGGGVAAALALYEAGWLKWRR